MKLIAKTLIIMNQPDGPAKEIKPGEEFDADGARAQWLIHAESARMADTEEAHTPGGTEP